LDSAPPSELEAEIRLEDRVAVFLVLVVLAPEARVFLVAICTPFLPPRSFVTIANPLLFFA
jgi:hypothetical protein